MMKIRTARPSLAIVAIAALAVAACDAGDESSPSAPLAAQSASAAPMPSDSHRMPSSSEPSADPSAAASEAAEDGEETSVFDLEIGDCFSESGDQTVSVVVVDCEQPHVYEVFALVTVEGGEDDPYPGDEVIGSEADAGCEAPFAEYVGLDYADSQWYVTSLTPTESTWAEGDREIVCLLNLEDESEVTGSAEGSGE